MRRGTDMGEGEGTGREGDICGSGKRSTKEQE